MYVNFDILFYTNFVLSIRQGSYFSFNMISYLIVVSLACKKKKKKKFPISRFVNGGIT